MISSLLVANRGEIARRIMRTARDMGMRTVAVYTDADAAAPFVADADRAMFLAGGSYLNGAEIIAAAQRVGVDAIHPGYGFLSENAEFARAVEAAGLVWVGPPADAIAAMGDKLEAKSLAERVGVPTLPMADGAGAAASVGFPLLVKAAAGGGGKGMRIVDSAAELDEAVAAAEREALAAFGDGRVFLERYVARSRHVEVQIVGDQHGNLVHLGERECSIQRRHQKIIEEAPSPVVDEAMRAQMGEAALRLAKAIGYISAGTVEFLVDDEPDATGQRPFWFLEANTRIQVEHPVTEAVTGLDIVRLQLRVAMGEPLDIEQADVTITGHAVEARLYAEDPEAGFLPATGTVAAWQPALSPAARFDSGIEQGSVVGLQFDPMLAKVIVSAPTRREAATKLALVLDRTHIGGVTTNRDFLASTLRTPAFLDGDTTTDFIDRIAPAPTRAHDGRSLLAAASAAVLWLQGHNKAHAPVLGFMPAGWQNARLPASKIVLAQRDSEIELTYRLGRDGVFTFGDGRRAQVHCWTPTGVEATIDGERFATSVVAEGSRLLTHGPDGDIEFVLRARFPDRAAELPRGGLVAPMPGTVIDVRVAAGDHVTAGQILVILEAMKMEHHATAPTAGVVTELMVGPGDQVDNGALLLVLGELEGDKSA
ncbi:acetyl/propionyl/methylcrotonyl-CoA carboxylase subunit alpha [[Mycobacterium] nativiensis]|uniref:Biotin carboxylase N-terminal domain-containing protein n=1 Tax=[Mycobacterium] nativiensis TaxID=2855503 RepID=A0ABU5XV56_9MYCO|nr:biotin carboxylase N-terminal domain-containing protein [Mycolicibacter sp. MYC340]MEB3031860.1 biotin carboxylase N-terminal domain-containing protein [Mycolicibacter sp. MYC340]